MESKLKYISLSLMTGALALVAEVTPARAADNKPNIVYILADDLGWKDVGFHGSDIKTPSIDELAAGGARLEQFYAQPMCTPTRAALMTGRYPLRYGLQTAVIPSAGTYGLATDEWLLPLAFTAPHAPYQAPKEYLDKYKNITDPARRAYAAMITAMDDEIGRVLDALEKRKMRENTLIIFQSDNGGPRSAKFTGEVDTSKVNIPCDNGPYRDGKGTLYEGGTRVVALANWPGRIKAGAVDQPIHVVDVYPTLAG